MIVVVIVIMVMIIVVTVMNLVMNRTGSGRTGLSRKGHTLNASP